MKWLVLLLLLGLVGATAKNGCRVHEFSAIAFNIHDPSLRHQQMSMWLTTNAGSCSTQDLIVIWNNLASWAGTADSSEIRGKIIEGYRNAEIREKK
jgi:hypothetical protein